MISEFREKVNDLECAEQKIQLETYGNTDWRESKRQHDAEIEKLMEKKVKKEEEDDEYLPPLYGGLVGMTFLLIGSFLGYKIANHLFPTGVSMDLIGDDMTNGSALFDNMLPHSFHNRNRSFYRRVMLQKNTILKLI